MKSPLTLARRTVSFELSMYRSLFRWVTRRPDVPPDAVPFAYVGEIALLMWVLIGVSTIELVGLHLILPWETVRIAADILGAWTLVLMLGLMASFNVHPHIVTGSGLRIRHAAGTDITVPWDSIATIAVRQRSLDRARTVQIDRDEQGTVISVVIASRTNVDLTLSEPLVIPLPKGPESVTELRLCADEARKLVRHVREHLALLETSS